MDPVVTLLHRPDIQWPEFISFCQSMIRRSPTRSLDQSKIRPGLPASLVQALGEFQHEDTPPVPYIQGRDCDPALALLTFSFLIACDKQTMLELLKLGKIDVLAADGNDVEVVAATANLRVWREVILQGTHPQAPRSLRALINRIQHIFSVHGLAVLWQDHTRQPTSDGTVALVPRTRGHRAAP
jgi:hypothetical protein